MRQADKSVAFLTGMIIAALYVILLVSFSRETYVMRGGDPGVARASAAECADASRQVCTLDRPICTAASWPTPEPTCVVSVRMLRRMIAQRLKQPAWELEAVEVDSASE